MPLSREICRICFRVNPVGFYVPDDVWNAVIPPEHLSNVVCISCFARLADEKLVPWDRDIQLYPVSMYSHLYGGLNHLMDQEKPMKVTCERATKKKDRLG